MKTFFLQADRFGMLIMLVVMIYVFSPVNVYALEPTLSIAKPTEAPVDYTLPFPGLLPDHPLYFLKVIRDKLVDLFTSDSQKRVEFLLLMADKRIVMGQLLVDKGDSDLGRSTISKGGKYFLRATEELSILEKSKPESASRLRDKLLSAYKKHQQVLQGIYAKLDEKEQGNWQDIRDIFSAVGKNLQ